MQKRNQQSRSGWGGKRAGAGAPSGNDNAVKHGERSRRALRCNVDGLEGYSPLLALRASNLVIVERMGELMRDYPAPNSPQWRELMLLDGIAWQHTRQMVRIEKEQSKERLKLAEAEYLLALAAYTRAEKNS